jgi:acyl-CoA synthetase (AMP-forming)/AMP-acid ligase II
VADALTIPRLLQRSARLHPTRAAIREKDRGIWQSHTWREYHDHVRDFALGLAALGFTRGDRLSVIGDNRPRLYWAQVAAQCLGGASVPVYQDSIAKELAYVWNHADVSVIVAEDQEQVDKVLALKDQLPVVRHVVYDDPRGMAQYRFDWLRSFAEVQELGREFGRTHPGFFEAEIDRGAPAGVTVASVARISRSRAPPLPARIAVVATPAESATRLEKIGWLPPGRTTSSEYEPGDTDRYGVAVRKLTFSAIVRWPSLMSGEPSSGAACSTRRRARPARALPSL